MRYTSIIVLCLVSAIQLYGQDLRKVVRDELGSKEVWIDDYTGLLDGVHPVEVVVGHDANATAGLVRFPASGLLLMMDDVKHTSNRVEMVKTTTYGDTLYHMQMDCHRTECRGSWNTKQESLGIHMFGAKYDVSCKNMHYAELYQDEEEKIYQVTRHEDEVSMIFEDSVFLGSCLDASCSRIAFEDVTMDSLVHRKVYFMRNSKMSHLMIETDGPINTIALSPVSRLSYTCESYIDHQKRYSIQLPAVENTELLEFCKRKLGLSGQSDLRPTDEVMNDANQYETVSYVWCDVTYFDGSIVSGYLNAQSSDSEDIKEVAFIYDLERQEEILPRKAFSRRIRRLIQIKDYPMVVMNGNNFVFTSYFDPIEGVKSKEWAHASLSEYVKNKTLKKYVK